MIDRFLVYKASDEPKRETTKRRAPKKKGEKAGKCPLQEEVVPLKTYSAHKAPFSMPKINPKINFQHHCWFEKDRSLRIDALIVNGVTKRRCQYFPHQLSCERQRSKRKI